MDGAALGGGVDHSLPQPVFWENPILLDDMADNVPKDLDSYLPFLQERVDYWTFYDFLDDNCVFYNGFRGPGHRAHSDSYMTLVDYGRLRLVLEEGRRAFGDPWDERLGLLADVLETGANRQPNDLVVSHTIRDFLSRGREKETREA